jgi:hypothetical protein
MCRPRRCWMFVLASITTGACLDTDSIDNDRGRSIPQIVEGGEAARGGSSTGGGSPDAGGGGRRGESGTSGSAGGGRAGSSGQGGSDAAQSGAGGSSDVGPNPELVAGTATAAGCSSYQLPAAGMCGGYYCGVDQATLTQALDAAATCGGDPEFTCDGRLVLVVGDCARGVKSAMPFASNAELRPMIEACVRADADIPQDLPADCLVCFVDAAVCAGDNCLIECLSGDSPGCDSCRIENDCQQPVFACGGLPNPL